VLLAVFWIGFLGAIGVTIVVGRHRKELPLAPIGEAPDGVLVRLVGTVVADNGLRAPLSGRACTCYWVEISAQKSRERGRWRSQDARVFRLTDPTGTASVPIEGVHLEVSADHIHETSAARLTHSLRVTLERLGVKLEKVSELEMYEGIIADGDEIEVVGCGIRVPLPGDRRERGFRDPSPGLLELHGAVHLVGARRPIRIVE